MYFLRRHGYQQLQFIGSYQPIQKVSQLTQLRKPQCERVHEESARVLALVSTMAVVQFLLTYLLLKSYRSDCNSLLVVELCLTFVARKRLWTLTAVIVNGHDEGKYGAERYNPTDWWRPGSFTMLDLHPAIYIVTCERKALPSLGTMTCSNTERMSHYLIRIAWMLCYAMRNGQQQRHAGRNIFKITMVQ